MDYQTEIIKLKEELKGFDVGHIGRVANETKEKTNKDKRKICLLGAYEEISHILNIWEDEQINENEDHEREQHPEYREPLSIEKEEVYKILLSWGGGSDGFKLYFKDKELLRGVYFMSDWGEYQEIDLNNEEAEHVYNFYLYGDLSHLENY